MTTRIVNALHGGDSAVSDAVDVLRSGGLVAFPTETVYGLGADAFNEDAVRKVFQVKGRPSDNPVIVHVADIGQFLSIGRDISSVASELAKRFWPGPLTLVVRHRDNIPHAVTGGLPTVALRMPDHPVTLALIRKFGKGIIGPSANISGRPSPTTAQHVLSDLNGAIDLILDAGPTRIGLESTVLDVTTSPPTILRLGGIPREIIEKEIGPLASTDRAGLLARSPGTRHRHYAPKTRVVLVGAGDARAIAALAADCEREGKRPGFILHSLRPSLPENRYSVIATPAEEYGRTIFDSMRKLDALSLDLIVIEAVPEAGVGEAVMDRLRRAAAG